jgi:uncharacterized protein YjiS (DUF1127 family)
MSTIHAATKQQVYSPLEVYWNAFLEWRKRERLRTQLCQLTERELTDIGITRREIDYIAPKPATAMPHRSTGWRNGSALIVMMLCSACLAFASDARAQCTASDVLQNQGSVSRQKAPGNSGAFC